MMTTLLHCCLGFVLGELPISERIENLGHPQFQRRVQAQRILEKFGEDALPSLRQALHHPNLEVVRRAGMLVETIERQLFGPIKLMTGHTSSVVGLALTPDGTQIYSGSNDSTIRLWDLKTGLLRKSLGGPSGPVWCVAADPGGSNIAVGGGSWAYLLDPEKESTLRTFQGANGSLRCLTFTRDGKYLIGGSFDQRLYLWSIEEGTRPLRVFQGHGCAIMCLALSPDGKTLASGGGQNDQTVRLWDVDSAREIRCLKGHGERVMGVAFSPDGKLLASASWDHSIRIWDLTTGKTSRVLDRHAEVYAVAFTPDGNHVLSGGADSSLDLWNLADGALLRTYRGHTSYISSVLATPDGQFAITASQDKSLCLWKLPTKK